jgi:hypothetical protein
MSSVSNQVQANPDFITLTDLFKIIWDRKVLFVLVTLIGVITTSIVATKLPKKITYSVLYKTPVLYNSYLELAQKMSPRISYSCIDDCKVVELSYKVSQSESSNKAVKMVFDKFIMDSQKLRQDLNSEAMASNNKEALLLNKEIEFIKNSLQSLNSVFVNAQNTQNYQAANATLKNITDYKILLLEKESKLKEITKIQPGKIMGSIKATPVKSKTKLVLLAGVILSLIAAFCLVLMLEATSKNKK